MHSATILHGRASKRCNITSEKNKYLQQIAKQTCQTHLENRNVEKKKKEKKKEKEKNKILFTPFFNGL